MLIFSNNIVILFYECVMEVSSTHYNLYRNLDRMHQ